MIGPLPGRWMRAWAGALLALLAYGWLAPGVSLAGSCEHRGVPAGIAEADAAQFGRLARAGALPTSEGGPSQPGKCSGPTCSEHPSSPLAPKPLDPPRSEGWGATAPPIATPESPAARYRTPEAAVRPTWSGPAIFHPPRPSCLPTSA